MEFRPYRMFVQDDGRLRRLRLLMPTKEGKAVVAGQFEVASGRRLSQPVG